MSRFLYLLFLIFNLYEVSPYETAQKMILQQMYPSHGLLKQRSII